MITVNGKVYQDKTKSTVCKICTAQADGRIMYVKQYLPDDMVVIECPYCEVYNTVRRSTIEVASK